MRIGGCKMYMICKFWMLILDDLRIVDVKCRCDLRFVEVKCRCDLRIMHTICRWFKQFWMRIVDVLWRTMDAKCLWFAISVQITNTSTFHIRKSQVIYMLHPRLAKLSKHHIHNLQIFHISYPQIVNRLHFTSTICKFAYHLVII